MARRADIEARLQRWAQVVTVGDGSGFPAVNVLDRSWSPPSPGTTPTLKVAKQGDAAETHSAIRQLSMRLRNTVVAHYCLKLGAAEHAERVGCAPSTVHARIDEAHRQLAAALHAPIFCNIDDPG
jgi:DNA-directed RNA polymerase specialized sigma24 family protein